MKQVEIASERDSKKMTRITVSLPAEYRAMLARLAKKENLAEADIIRRAVGKYLEGVEQDVREPRLF